MQKGCRGWLSANAQTFNSASTVLSRTLHRVLKSSETLSCCCGSGNVGLTSSTGTTDIWGTIPASGLKEDECSVLSERKLGGCTGVDESVSETWKPERDKLIQSRDVGFKPQCLHFLINYVTLFYI